MTIKWLGHSCFKVNVSDVTIIFDPYSPGSVPGLGKIKESADVVSMSHEHSDHNYAKGVKMTGEAEKKNFSLKKLRTFHDDAGGKKRGMSDIAVFECGGMKVVHFGDLGCPLDTPGMIRAGDRHLLDGADVILLPVGGYYTIDGNEAAQVVKEVHPKRVIPMHYKGSGFGLPEISTEQMFLSNFDENEILRLGKSEIYLSGGDQTEGKILVLTPELKN